jgi:hypothetical protein
MTGGDDLFPIMLPGGGGTIRQDAADLRRAKVPFIVIGVPWSLIAPHEAQAQINHGQTLRRLAERGGLAASEVVAVLTDRRFQIMSEIDAARQLIALLTASVESGANR